MAKKATYQVFVYGTLRSGHHNHGLLEGSDATFIGDTKVGGYILLDLGAFPACIPSYDKNEFKVVGEVYSVDGETLSRLDRLEGVFNKFYMRQVVDTEWGRAFIYVLHPERIGQYRANKLFWLIEGDYDDPESLLLEDNDLFTYVDHIYLTAGKITVPDKYRELQPLIIDQKEKEAEEPAPTKELVALPPPEPQVRPFNWSAHFPLVEEAS